MIRNVLVRALALLTFVAPLACKSNEPRSQADVEKEEKRDLARAVSELDDATTVLREMTSSKNAVPLEQRQRARCAAVLSGGGGGLILGGRYGDGVVSCRTAHGWSGPVFIKMGGGTAGLQAGVEHADVVMLVMTDGSRLFRKGFQLGADASVAAGPAGEGRQASTDAQMKADILTYARTSGLFAGVELSGVGVKQNLELANAIYGSETDAGVILQGAVPSPKEAEAFLAQLRASFPDQ